MYHGRSEPASRKSSRARFQPELSLGGAVAADTSYWLRSFQDLDKHILGVYYPDDHLGTGNGIVDWGNASMIIRTGNVC